MEIIRSWTEIPSFEEIKALHPSLKGILFDMDGTLLNTEPIHAIALRETLVTLSGNNDLMSADELNEKYKGLHDPLVFAQCINEKIFTNEISLIEFLGTKSKCVIQETRSQLDSIFSDKLKALINDIYKHDIKLGLVTNSESDVTLDVLQRLGIIEMFNPIICRGDCEFSKPDPQPYQKAMELLELDPSSVVVFEDSTPGIASALAAKTNVHQAKWYS